MRVRSLDGAKDVAGGDGGAECCERCKAVEML
jgi:hypothetical protein